MSVTTPAAAITAQQASTWLRVAARATVSGPTIAYRPVRDAERVAVRLTWWRDDPDPSTQPVIELLTTLYRKD
ncbi:hypothetical protein ACF05L_09460 [Streptomyces bobili]|uniref:hypothetical protein n=1 Tax=Streptomyces bobili TaxID=67280 RepID=UPI0036FA8BE7